VPGMEAAGIADEAGSGVPDRLKVDDAVTCHRPSSGADFRHSWGSSGECR
jgi:NADPH:quinone reductase-like Zn-dependent oxidoreductase